jgi:hypothetical protein
LIALRSIGGVLADVPESIERGAAVSVTERPIRVRDLFVLGDLL